MLRSRLLLVVSVLLASVLPLLPSVALAAAPANDNLADATTIAAFPYADTVNTIDATVQGGEPDPTCSGTAGYTVWYRFTPATSGVYEITSGASTPVLSLFQATTLTFPGLTPVECAVAPTSTFTLKMRPRLTAGLLYVVRSGALGGNGSSGHNMSVTGPLATPANDDLNAATPITSLPFENVVNTYGATTQASEPDPTCGPGRLHNSVWYTFTASRSSLHRFDATNSSNQNSNEPSVIEIFTAPTLDFGSLNSIGCAGGAEATHFAAVELMLTAGTTYAVRRSSFRPYGMSLSRFYLLGPPSNDHLAGAHVVNSLPFTNADDHRFATVEGSEPNATCRAGDPPNGSTWFAFTPATTGRYQIDSIGSLYSIDVFTASTLTYGGLTSIACVQSPHGALSPLLQAGVQYAIRFASIFAPRLNISGPFAAPPNDNLASATEINSGSLPFTETIKTIAASVEGGEPAPTCGAGYLHNTIWYTFTPATNGLYRFDTAGSSGGSTFTGRTALDIFAAPTLAYGSLTEIICDTYDTGSATLINVELTGRVQYVVRLGAATDYGLSSAKLNVTYLPGVPDNDNLGAASTIGSLPFTESLDTRGASFESGEPTTSCHGGNYGSVWYLLTPATTGYYKLDLAGSSQGAILDIVVAPALDFSTFTPVGCFRPNNPDNLRSQIFELAAGTRYAIRTSTASPGGLANSTVGVSGPFVGAENDHLADATRVTGLPYTDTVDATTSSPENDEPITSCFGGTGRSIWYVFTPSTTASYRIDTSYQSLAVFQAPTLIYAALTEVGCESDQPISLVMTLQAGTQYAIRSTSQSALAGEPDVETSITRVSTRPSISVFNPTLKGDPGQGGRVLAFADIGVATDPEGESLTIDCDPDLGTVVPFGTTSVTCTATDPFGLTRTDSGTVTVVDDSIAPTSTATRNPIANAANWNMANTTVNLSATDNSGGAGVKRLTYSATGAQTIASTSVNASSTSFEITAEGITTVRMFAVDLVGNVEPTRTLVVRIDKQLPTSTSPVATMNRSVNANGTVPFTLDWDASDPAGGSGMEQTILQQRLNGNSTRTNVALATATSTNKVIALTSGNRYEYRTRARDRAGNFSQTSSTLPWAAGPSFLVSVVQDNATTGVVPAYSSSWSPVTGSTYFGGTARVATGIDQTVSVTFTGTEVAWISTIGPGQGTALVTLDDDETVVDLYTLSATTRQRRIAFHRDGLTNTTHTLTIRVLEKNPASTSRRVVFDGLVLTAP